MNGKTFRGFESLSVRHYQRLLFDPEWHGISFMMMQDMMPYLFLVHRVVCTIFAA
jgi:hypothetical protein